VGETGRFMREVQRRVAVSRFAICETEVSVRQYELVMGQRPSGCDGDCEPHQPIRWVSWHDAILFFNALTKYENDKRRGMEALTLCYDEQTGAWDRGCTGYRLPTEAEWEFVARAGTNTAWSFGSDVTDVCSYGNTNIYACDDGFASLAPVKVEQLQPNPWGLHGIHGNVWEWVYDVDGSYGGVVIDPENANDTDTNTDSDIDAIRVARGGSYHFAPEFARSASRSKSYPWALNPDLGFRCARGPRHISLLDRWLAARRRG
ncbi:MAG TPA: formylglycine-generating enzyme family protein, partial [Enhygromyxa sp.]|nr:formylglycine-generating enzyme family protein [Enhygromyxa sp.]